MGAVFDNAARIIQIARRFIPCCTTRAQQDQEQSGAKETAHLPLAYVFYFAPV
jgi:hypothetical protein